jgi:hypothetical protein
VTRKSITTSHAAVACDVCGRTLLRGEQADVFIAGGSRRMVCELCTARATHEGWIREGMDLSAGARRSDGPRRSLFGRLRARRGDERPHAPAPRGGEAPATPPGRARRSPRRPRRTSRRGTCTGSRRTPS